MKRLCFLLPVLAVVFGSSASAQSKPIPDALKPWEQWATWDDNHRWCPTPYSDPKKPLCLWPSRLGLQVEASGGKFDIAVTAFSEAWLALPGSAEVWPLEVKVDGASVPVLEHGGGPAVKLQPGTRHIEGAYRWTEVPQRLLIPREIGILALVLDGKPVESPVWDAQGFLWLKRNASTEETDKNFLSVKLYAALEDGIPLWLHTEIELIVSGKSREEEIGTVLPEGWKLASVQGAIPVVIDDAGRMKAQVRAGKWKVQADAFRFDNPKEFHYPANAKAAAEQELVAFRARPEFRIVEIIGPPAIDVSQTTFPDQWRELPVYRWETNTPLRIEERMRGMGDQKPAGLTIARQLWLDEDGSRLTFRDQITGTMQQIWRLDAAPGQDLGSVRTGAQGQLITRNPQSGAAGVEIRTRNLNLEATGRMSRAASLPATGWQADADSLRVSLNLPPGWRLFALFGADWVRGDWLTAWTLLDLFLLLIFSLAVYRLWGFGPGVLAFLAFGLAYHEPGAPRYLWLFLLIPLALTRVVPDGWGKRVVGIAKWVTIGLFILALVPFVVRQVQQALYPQLEIVRSNGFLRSQTLAGPAPDFTPAPAAASSDVALAEREYAPSSGVFSSASVRRAPSKEKDNLLYDAKARIQTGPGVPEWMWREVSFGWNGPVTASQQVKPVLISLSLERVLTVLRVVLLLALASVLLGARRLGTPVFRASGKAVVVLLLSLSTAAPAQEAAVPRPASGALLRDQEPIVNRVSGAFFPDQVTLEQLRARLLEVSDAYPTAANIPTVTLTLDERKLTIDAEIHAAVRTAVPLPGRLPVWSPVNVLVDDKPEVALRREDNFLWVVLEAGVHRVRMEGSLANLTEWEWTFQLKPRQVKIEAPGWTVSGVRADGVPEAQVFFALKQKAAPGTASYDRQDLQSSVVIDRHLELGLVWQLRTTVTRLSPATKAIALRVPLLPGENVLSANAVVKDGFIEVRLGAQEKAFTWESGLTVVSALKLATRAEDAWVERWHLVASPVWNVTIGGLAPIFETGSTDLVPVWQPWPGENVDLTISRPEAIPGATITVHRGRHQISLGKRQRTAKLDLSLRCSLGEDFLVELPPDAEITSLTQNGKAIPVRKDGNKLVIPVRPGEQEIGIAWKSNVALGFRAQAGDVRLPVESANIHTVIQVPDDRWVWWTAGPRRGPAVRFWGVLICSLLAAVALARVQRSPLRAVEWMLLAIGLTQVPLPAALVVVGWLFYLVWRRGESFQQLGRLSYNWWQVVLIGLTAISLGILVFAVGEGLLGQPEMFITGNGSRSTNLQWFQARSESSLPRPALWSVSIWWYRFAMLVWALWLAAALIRWLRWGWQCFSTGGFFRAAPKPAPVVPPLPKT